MNGQNRSARRGMMGRGHMGRGGEKANDFKGTWKKLLIYCRKYLGAMIVALIFAVIGTVFTLIGPDKLSELTDTITAGIMPDIEAMKTISEAVSGNITDNMTKLTEAITANLSDTSAFQSKAQEVLLSDKVSDKDKAEFQRFLENAAKGQTGQNDVFALPQSVLEMLYGSVSVNGSKIGIADQIKMMQTLSEMQQTEPPSAQENAADDTLRSREEAALRQKMMEKLPQPVKEAMYSDVFVDGTLITADDQKTLVELMSGLDESDTEATLAKMKNLPESIQRKIDKSIDMQRVLSIALFLITIYLLGYLLSAAQGFIMATVTQRVSKRMRSDISAKINRLPMSYYHKMTTGDILSRVTNDVDTIGQSLNQSVGTLLSAVVLLFGSLLMMFKTNVILTLTAIGASVIGFIFMFTVMGRSQKYFARQQKHLGEINGHIEEIFAGHTVVKGYNGEEKAQAEFDEMNDNLRTSAFKAQCLAGLMMPMMNFIGNFGYVAVCIVGGMLALDGQIGFGVIVAFMLYVRYFTQPLSQIAQAMQSLQSAAAAGERVFEFLEAEEMEDESGKTKRPEESKGNVEFSHVRFGYDGSGKPVIYDFSVSVRPGQKIAIVGPTGAGKTTLVNLLMRFYEIQGGKILIDGMSTKELRREDVHAQFCMVLQDTWLFEGTLRENLAYCTENVSDEKLKEACKAVGLYHFVKTLPNGFDTYLNDNVSLSQGQKQQLTIARAMIADKPMLILDEATSSVDTRTELKIQAAMDRLMENRTSFVIAHRLSTIKNADMILVLKDGDVIEKGTHEALMEQNGFYAELYNSQFTA